MRWMRFISCSIEIPSTMTGSGVVIRRSMMRLIWSSRWMRWSRAGIRNRSVSISVTLKCHARYLPSVVLPTPKRPSMVTITPGNRRMTGVSASTTGRYEGRICGTARRNPRRQATSRRRFRTAAAPLPSTSCSCGIPCFGRRIACPGYRVECKLCGRDVFCRDSNRLVHCRLRNRARLRSGENFSDLGVDPRLRQDDVPRLMQGRFARLYYKHIAHRLVVELAPSRHGSADGIDVSSALQPRSFQNRLPGRGGGDDDIRTAHRRLRIHHLGAMLRGESLRMRSRTAPYAHLVELADLGESLQMCSGLDAAAQQRENA